MKKTVLFVIGTLLALSLTSIAHADGCYICGTGSSNACKNYCRYKGSDTFENRKICEKKGCKISGTASCPTAANYKVCAIKNSREEQKFKGLHAGR